VEEVIQVGTTPAFASVSEALDMVQAGLSYLAAADAAQLSAATQAECLRRLELSDAIATAARAFILAGFTAGQGYADDADYSAVAWLIHQTRITRGAAVGHAAWAGRVATHPRVLAALAAGQVTEPVGRLIRLWTGKLPEKYRDDADEVLIAAAAARLDLEDLAALFAEMYQRARSELPDQDPDRDFEDRSVKLATTFGGAGVIHGDLTPECAEMAGRVLDALAAPAGKDDDRTKDQRYHDALHEAMKRLVASGLLPERAGNPVRAWAHISLADLLLLDGDSALQEEWTAQVRARWAASRAFAAETGSEGGAWLGARLGGPSLPLDIGYAETVPAGIRNAVMLRDRKCRWAGGCNQPASACDVHHTKHKKHGGKTSTADCVLLCFFHHQIVIHKWGWTLILNPDGTTSAWNKNRTKVLRSHGPPARAG
jgi:hypothetical protein